MSGTRLYPCAASARNSTSVMMLQRFSQRTQLEFGGVAFCARRGRGLRAAPAAPVVATRPDGPGPVAAVERVEAHCCKDVEFVSIVSYAGTIASPEGICPPSPPALSRPGGRGGFFPSSRMRGERGLFPLPARGERVKVRGRNQIHAD